MDLRVEAMACVDLVGDLEVGQPSDDRVFGVFDVDLVVDVVLRPACHRCVACLGETGRGKDAPDKCDGTQCAKPVSVQRNEVRIGEGKRKSSGKIGKHRGRISQLPGVFHRRPIFDI